ncbi:macrophage mannose receptor 1-like [Myxocyprinus asiaticus]|uniref:macrophage mannose receptor 1-like n=1 Tax=Myxocyprinus asiaticus TaxID=70543 RepID=UPI002221B068|nr:macrophage mannose receptor 1-like [Myxocyprinus asiaticus]
MEHIYLFILSLSGVLSLTLCNTHDYILIKQLKTWGDAQTYCRENHVDLATVQSNENFKRLQEVADTNKFTGLAWIGLYNDINSWRWSYQDESQLFKSWLLGQPDNYGSGEECVVLRYDGVWYDMFCWQLRYFLCYDERSNSTDSYVLVTKSKTWLDAQTHCRQHYTDLVTIRNQTDNDLLAKKINGITDFVWIGLFRDKWKWSDQANFTYSTQVTVQRLVGANENCANVNYWGYIEDYPCSTTFYFYCDTVWLKRQIMRLEVKANQNVTDTKLKALVLKQIEQTLNEQGWAEDVTMTWMKQHNGRVFQKINTFVPNSSNGSSSCSDHNF